MPLSAGGTYTYKILLNTFFDMTEAGFYSIRIARYLEDELSSDPKDPSSRPKISAPAVKVRVHGRPFIEGPPERRAENLRLLDASGKLRKPEDLDR